MFLLDSNIIVYSYLSQYEYLRELLTSELVYVSEISRLEVLVYHKLTNDEETYFKDIFNLVPIIFPSQEIFDTAIDIRKVYNLKLGDSLIAATALEKKLSIYTRNLSDFGKVKSVSCIDPLR
ncbi:MAG: type II toxin-antitoxin system VapC family toxin [Bacteroidetes bacterium]|jgi:predicted nucleic acid-binding protein|nr:type II toxin-antitoxin system VapC family toxin [Bacteroidota bacterium]